MANRVKSASVNGDMGGKNEHLRLQVHDIPVSIYKVISEYLISQICPWFPSSPFTHLEIFEGFWLSNLHYLCCVISMPLLQVLHIMNTSIKLVKAGKKLSRTLSVVKAIEESSHLNVSTSSICSTTSKTHVKIAQPQRLSSVKIWMSMKAILGSNNTINKFSHFIAF